MILLIPVFKSEIQLGLLIVLILIPLNLVNIVLKSTVSFHLIYSHCH